MDPKEVAAGDGKHKAYYPYNYHYKGIDIGDFVFLTLLHSHTFLLSSYRVARLIW